MATVSTGDDELFPAGKFTDLTDKIQLHLLNELLQDIIDREPAGTGIRRVDIIRKSDDELVNNSTTLQNDDLLLAPLNVNETVTFICTLAHIGNTTANFKCGFTIPSGATIRWSTIGGVTYDTGGSFIIVDERTASGDKIDVDGSTISRRVSMIGVVVNGGTAGDLQLQWAQSTAAVVDTKVLTNSFLLVWRV